MKKILFFFTFILIISFYFGVSPQVTHAIPDDGNRGIKSGFVPLVGIPYVKTDEPMSLPKYVNALYTASISIAAFMAVVKIIFAGVKYMISDMASTKEDAKKDIRGALIGLLIVVGAVLILNTINPQLTSLRALQGPHVNLNSTGVTTLTNTAKICQQYGVGNCEVKQCSSLSDGSGDILGWLGGVGAGIIGKKVGEIAGELADGTVNLATCSSICKWYYGGTHIPDTWTSGTCVYPTDSEVIEETL